MVNIFEDPILRPQGFKKRNSFTLNVLGEGSTDV